MPLCLKTWPWDDHAQTKLYRVIRFINIMGGFKV